MNVRSFVQLTSITHRQLNMAPTAARMYGGDPLREQEILNLEYK